MARVLSLVALTVVVSVSEGVYPGSAFRTAVRDIFQSNLTSPRETLGGLSAYRLSFGSSVDSFLTVLTNKNNMVTIRSLFQDVQVSSAQL